MKGGGGFFPRVLPTRAQDVDNLWTELETFRDSFDPFLDIPYWISIWEDLDKVLQGDTINEVRRRGPRRARGTPKGVPAALRGHSVRRYCLKDAIAHLRFSIARYRRKRRKGFLWMIPVSRVRKRP
jgi:hypothetical protein